MKKLLFSLLAIACFSVATFAQGEASLKTADKKLRNYRYDREKNADDLLIALEEISKVSSEDEIASSAKYLITSGEIHKELYGNETFRADHPKSIMLAYESLSKAAGAADIKKFQVKEVSNSLSSLIDPLINAGATIFEKGEYVDAYKQLSTAISIDDQLVANGGEPFLTEDRKIEITFFTALAANYAKLNEEAKAMFLKMYDAGLGKERPGIYENLFMLTVDEDAEKAFQYLDEGRKAHPTNMSLLIAKINYMLGKDDLPGAEAALQEAIANEPDNKTLYSALGKVYDDLYNDAVKEDPTTGGDFFTKAETYYSKATELDGEFLEAVYNLGALYYNKAVLITKEMNELPFSEAKKFDAMKVDRDALVEKALPLFLDAERIDGKDLNTIIALKEVYAIKDDLAKSAAYKAKMDAIQNGGN